MVFGKGALASQGGHHRKLKEFGKLAQFIPGAGVEHTLPRPKQGTLCREQHTNGFTDVLRGPCGLHCFRRRIAEFRFREVLLGNVVRHFQQNRSGTSAAQLSEGSPHELRRARGKIDAAGPFGDARQILHSIEIG